MTQNIREEYHNKFSNRFIKIAELADLGDDEGYGKGLARLQYDIEDFFLSHHNTTLKEIEEEGIRVISTHEEDEDWGYCDTGSDMDFACRSDCVEMAVKRFKQLIHQKLIK